MENNMARTTKEISVYGEVFTGTCEAVKKLTPTKNITPQEFKKQCSALYSHAMSNNPKWSKVFFTGNLIPVAKKQPKRKATVQYQYTHDFYNRSLGEKETLLVHLKIRHKNGKFSLRHFNDDNKQLLAWVNEETFNKFDVKEETN
jgi:hypothetical protein